MLALGVIEGWRECFIIAANRKLEELDALKDLAGPTSRWKNSARISKAYDSVKMDVADILAAAREEGRRKGLKEAAEAAGRDGNGADGAGAEVGNYGIDAEGQTRGERKLIDYSDPANRRKLYNEVIRDAKDDPKTRLDAAKVFEQLQQADKQAAKEQKQVRAYLPLNCYDCPLYLKAAKKVTI